MPTIEQYQEWSNDIITSPDKAPLVLQEIMAGIKEDLTTRDGLQEQLETMQESLRDARDTNAKMFLQLADQGSASANDEPSPDDGITDLLTNQFGLDPDALKELNNYE